MSGYLHRASPGWVLGLTRRDYTGVITSMSFAGRDGRVVSANPGSAKGEEADRHANAGNYRRESGRGVGGAAERGTRRARRPVRRHRRAGVAGNGALCAGRSRGVLSREGALGPGGQTHLSGGGGGVPAA